MFNGNPFFPKVGDFASLMQKYVDLYGADADLQIFMERLERKPGSKERFEFVRLQKEEVLHSTTGAKVVRLYFIRH